MSKSKIQGATALALFLMAPFAAGAVQATETAKPAVKAVEPSPSKSIPVPTIDTNKDGKADAWDRDGNGIPDAWDVNEDGKPDLFDNNGDGKPDEEKAMPVPVEGPVQTDIK